MLVSAPLVAEGVDELLAQGIVVPGKVAPYVMLDGPGNGATGIGLRPSILMSVAPSGMVLPITLEVVPGTWIELPLAVDVQEELGVRPPPSKVEEGAMGAVPLVPPIESVALQAELVAGLRPPTSISVAPSGTPALFELMDPLLPVALSGEVAPIPKGLTVVCARVATQA